MLGEICSSLATDSFCNFYHFHCLTMNTYIYNTAQWFVFLRKEKWNLQVKGVRYHYPVHLNQWGWSALNVSVIQPIFHIKCKPTEVYLSAWLNQLARTEEIKGDIEQILLAQLFRHIISNHDIMQGSVSAFISISPSPCLLLGFILTQLTMSLSLFTQNF